MNGHSGYETSERYDSDDYRNGHKRKKSKLSLWFYGNQNSTRQKIKLWTSRSKEMPKDISDIDQKIIAIYAKGMTIRQISDLNL